MAVLVVAALGAAAGPALATPPAVGVEAGRTPTVGVAPPTPGAGSPAWVSRAVAARLPGELRALGAAVLPAHRLEEVVEARGLPFAVLSHASLLREARAAGLQRLVLGGQRVDGDDVRLALRVVDLVSGEVSPERVAGGSLASLPTILRRLAAGVANDLGAPGQPGMLSPLASVDALRRHARALEERDPEARRAALAAALEAEPGDAVTRLALARAQLEVREAEAALSTLRGGRFAGPEAREARFLEARLELLEARHAAAATLLESLARERESPGVLANLALARLRDGGSGAVTAARRAVDLAPEDPAAAFDLGWALFRAGQADEAAFWLEGVVSREPQDVEARLVRAWALHAAGREAEARSAWDEIASAAAEYDSPARPDLARRYGRVFVDEWPLPAAEGGRSDAELAAVHVGRAERLLSEGDPDAAATQLARAVYLDPYGPRAHRLLSHARLALGERQEAVNELRMSLWGRDDAEVRAELAALLADLGRLDEARAEAARVIESDPDNTAARRVLEPGS